MGGGRSITLDSQIYSPFSSKMIPEHCKRISVSQLVQTASGQLRSMQLQEFTAAPAETPSVLFLMHCLLFWLDFFFFYGWISVGCNLKQTDFKPFSEISKWTGDSPTKINRINLIFLKLLWTQTSKLSLIAPLFPLYRCKKLLKEEFYVPRSPPHLFSLSLYFTIALCTIGHW